MGTYALGSASADVVRKAGAVVWVAHEDGGLDSVESVASKSGTCTTAECVVHDLATLCFVSTLLVPTALDTGDKPESIQ